MTQPRTETMTVNMGPQHPSTHGVLRLVLELDGEVVLNAETTIGYLHTGIEKTTEQKKWQQVIPLVERMDYLAGQTNSLAFVTSVERLAGIEVPDRVQWIRTLIAELQRINSHLVWLGTSAMDTGAVSVMLYCFRERELLLNINEMLAGFRMFPSYFRIGGLREDLPGGFHAAVKEFLERMPVKLREYEDLLTDNKIFRKRTTGIGVLTGEQAVALGLVGPIARGSGVGYDVRRTFPYLKYPELDFEVITRTNGDVFARYQVRVAEMHESIKLARQCLEKITPTGPWAIDDPKITPPPKDKVYTEMEALIQHFLLYSQGFTVPAGTASVPIEGPRGELAFTVTSDGTNRPWRVKSRAPSLFACQALPMLCRNALIADVIAIIGSTGACPRGVIDCGLTYSSIDTLEKSPGVKD